MDGYLHILISVHTPLIWRRRINRERPISPQNGRKSCVGVTSFFLWEKSFWAGGVYDVMKSISNPLKSGRAFRHITIN